MHFSACHIFNFVGVLTTTYF